MKSPRTIKTHLPGNLLPPDIMKKKARIIYVIRNPKDVAVSLYNFYVRNPRLPTPASWTDFVDDFLLGKSKYNFT